MDLEQFIREYMKEYIKKSQPDMDISENSAFDDIFIKPMIAIMKPIFPILANTELKSNLKFSKYLTDEEIEDIGVNNYAVYRDTGTMATTLQTFGFSRVPERGITIPQGVIVSTQSGLMYTTSYSTTYSKTEMQRSFNSATQTYDIIASVRANGIGSMYNVGENMINICQTTFSEYLVYTTNKSAVTNGSDNESIDSYISKCLTYYVNQHLGTRPGYRRDLMQKAKQLSDIKVIGYQDKGMERDTIEVVQKDVNNKTVFGDPVQYPEDEDKYRYALTQTKHIGGCVDIYVRGSEYAVETLQAPINSNIICLEGPIDGESLSVVTGASSVPQSVRHNVRYITSTATKIPDYKGELIETKYNVIQASDDAGDIMGIVVVSDKTKKEIIAIGERINEQVTFKDIFDGETVVPANPLAFKPGEYPLIKKISFEGQDLDVSFERDPEEGTDPMGYIRVNNTNRLLTVSSSDWGTDNLLFTLKMTLKGKYNNDIEYTVTKKFLAAAVRDDSVSYSKSYDVLADTAVIFVEERFETPTAVTVKYTFLDKDADQYMNETYMVGYDRKLIELKAPLSESLLSVYYEKNGSAWTNSDFNDWALQLKRCSFDAAAQVVDVDTVDSEERDLIDTARLLRYRLSMNRIIEGDEIDDDGLSSSHDVHKYDSYYKNSSQEKVFLTLQNGSNEEEFQNLFQLLPNTSASGSDTDYSGLSVQYSYNNTLHNIQTSMFNDDDRIITADVLVKEAFRTPVNVAIKINLKNSAELTSAMRAQIQAAVSQLFSDAGINGRIEQSDIVGKLYTDSTTSGFVEYVRLALDAFYVPDDINAEIEYKNAGDYIQADEKSYLYLNKMIMDVTEGKKRLSRVWRIGRTIIQTGLTSLYDLINAGEGILGHTFYAEAFVEGGGVTLGQVIIVSATNETDSSKVTEDNNVAESGKTYNCCFKYTVDSLTSDKDNEYTDLYTNQRVVVE